MDDANRTRQASGGRAPMPWLLAAAMVGLAARLAFGLGYWTEQPLTRDEQEYLSLARSLAGGHGFVYDEALAAASVDPFGRAPGYPAFLALVGGGRSVAVHVPPAVSVAQAIVGAVGVLMIGLIAHRFAGPRAAVIAAAIAAVHPPLVWIAGYALSEAVFWPVALAAVWAFDHTAREGRAGAWAAAACGVLSGAAILVRPSMLFFLPLAALVLARRRHWIALAAFVLATTAVIAPWTVRNAATHGRLVIVAPTGGVNFWVGNHPLAVGDGDMAANPAIKIDNARLRAEHPLLTEEQMEPIYYREAWAWIRAHAGDWLLLELRKLFHLVVPVGPSYTLHSPRYYAASALPYLVLVALAIGAWSRVRRQAGLVTGLWILVASAVAAALVFFPHERFRIPIFDPALIILASAGLAMRRPVRSQRR